MFVMVTISFIENTFGTKAPELKLDRTLSVTMAQLRTVNNSLTSGPLFSYYYLDKYVKTLKVPESISISTFHNTLVIYKNNKKFNASIKFCDSEFFDILDFEFIEGKPFNSDDVTNKKRVAVINQDIRNKYFGGTSAIGKTIEADGKNYKVIGVVNNVSIMRIMPYSDIWVPITMSKADLNKPIISGAFPGYFSMVLAKDEDDIPKIQAEYRKTIKSIDLESFGYKELQSDIDTYAEALSRQILQSDRGNSNLFILILFLFMVLFMLLPVLNLINLNVSRIMERASEIGVRKAFGASKRTLIGQFIVENLILTLISGVLGLLLTYIVINTINISGLIEYSELTLDFRIFFYSLFITLFFGLFSGVYPAYKMSKLNPAEALNEA